MAANEEKRVGDVPDLFVGMREASEAFDVPYVRLHAAIREGRLTTYAERCEGRLVRRLRLGDLIALDPSLADRPLPKPMRAELSRAELPRREATAPPARRTPGSAPDPAPSAAVPARAGRRSRGDGASKDESLRYLWSELERVRAQVRDSREQQEDLVRQLLESGEDARRLFGKLAVDEESRRVAQAELDRERADVDRALAELQRARRFTLASVSVVVLLAMTAIGWVARTSIVSARAAGESAGDVSSAAADADAESSTHDAKPAAGPTEASLEGPTEGEDGTRADLVSLAADTTEPTSTPPASDESERAEPSEPPPFAPEVGDPEPEEHAEVIADGVAEEAANDRILPGRPPAGVQPGDRACALFAVTQPGMPLRGVLGPCWGRWNPTLAATVGSSRNGDEAYCRQHAFFERALGASLARARAEADLARDAGLVPPLLRMRVETAASAALAGAVPTWLESGFESGSVDGHHVRSVEGDENHWLVESWVRYVDFAGNDRRRTFRLEVLLGDGPEPDRERAFAWTDEASEEKPR